MMGEVFTTGQAAQLLGIVAARVSYAIQRGRAGQVTFCGGRAVLTPANVRQLARHFEVAVPPAFADDGCGKILHIEQQGTKHD